MIRRIDARLIQALQREAETRPRRRSHRNWHASATDAVQRFFVHLLPGTYVRPHCHGIDRRVETTLLLDGDLDLLHFDRDGVLSERIALRRGAVLGVQIDPQDWHSFHVRAPSTLFEVKAGPYDQDTDKRFADWAPAEGEPQVAALLAWFAIAKPGQRWTGDRGDGAA